MDRETGGYCKEEISASAGLNQRSKLLKEIGGIVWAGGGFGMVLDAEDWVVAMTQAFDRAVIQVYVGYLDVGWKALRIDRETVVLRSDGNRA